MDKSLDIWGPPYGANLPTQFLIASFGVNTMAAIKIGGHRIEQLIQQADKKVKYKEWAFK